MDARLHEAALTGDVDSLKEDAFILDKADGVAETSLHIASLHGHLEFAKAILSRKPQLARVLDSHQSSPLHLASLKGHVEVVKELLKSDLGMCLARDQDGMTPLHAAAMKGRVDVVKELMRAKSIVTRVLTNQREPILHFCVNHDRFEIVKALLECPGHDEQFVKMKDDDDNTILHLSVAKKHVPLTQHLLQNSKMREEVNALNINGLTALDVFLQKQSKSSKDMELEGILRRAEAKTANAGHLPKDSWIVQQPSLEEDRWKEHINWLNETRSTLMVVAILMATVTFQAGICPPGGVWSDDKDNHKAGESIMADKYPDEYIRFTTFNVMAFVSSLSIILFLISGFPLRQRFFIWTLTIITWIAVSSMMITYGQAFYALSTVNILDRVDKLEYPIWFLGWFLLIGLLFTVHTVRLIIRYYKKFRSMICRNEQASKDDAGNADVESRSNEKLV